MNGKIKIKKKTPLTTEEKRSKAADRTVVK